MKTLGHGCLEFIEQAIPDVSAKNHDTLILEGDLQNFIGESVAHGSSNLSGHFEFLGSTLDFFTCW